MRIFVVQRRGGFLHESIGVAGCSSADLLLTHDAKRTSLFEFLSSSSASLLQALLFVPLATANVPGFTL